MRLAFSIDEIRAATAKEKIDKAERFEREHVRIYLPVSESSRVCNLPDLKIRCEETSDLQWPNINDWLSVNRSGHKCEFCWRLGWQIRHHRWYSEWYDSQWNQMLLCRWCHHAIHFGGDLCVRRQSLAAIGDTGLGFTKTWVEYCQKRKAQRADFRDRDYPDVHLGDPVIHTLLHWVDDLTPSGDRCGPAG